jgi:ankyrin repeat protein
MKDLLEAIRANRADEVERLLRAQPELTSRRSPDGTSPLSFAVYFGRAALVDLIRVHRGQPDFFEACLIGDEATVRAQLAGGQDVNAYAPDGFTPLGLAVFFGHSALARLLLESGADVNARARNAQQVGAIHAAVSRGDVATLELLLTRGADPNLPQQQSFRPIQVAAANGNIAAVAELLLFGADPQVKTEDGKLPSDLAREKGHAVLAERLEKFETTRDSPRVV